MSLKKYRGFDIVKSREQHHEYGWYFTHNDINYTPGAAALGSPEETVQAINAYYLALSEPNDPYQKNATTNVDSELYWLLMGKAGLDTYSGDVSTIIARGMKGLKVKVVELSRIVIEGPAAGNVPNSQTFEIDNPRHALALAVIMHQAGLTLLQRQKSGKVDSISEG
jgi:uncharacterized membrane protein